MLVHHTDTIHEGCCGKSQPWGCRDTAMTPWPKGPRVEQAQLSMWGRTLVPMTLLGWGRGERLPTGKFT